MARKQIIATIGRDRAEEIAPAINGIDCTPNNDGTVTLTMTLEQARLVERLVIAAAQEDAISEDTMWWVQKAIMTGRDFQMRAAAK